MIMKWYENMHGHAIVTYNVCQHGPSNDLIVPNVIRWPSDSHNKPPYLISVDTGVLINRGTQINVQQVPEVSSKQMPEISSGQVIHKHDLLLLLTYNGGFSGSSWKPKKRNCNLNSSCPRIRPRKVTKF